jgi:RNA polymerase sigma factor (sigma-70 family)
MSVLPTVKTHAKIQFRRLPAEQREDAIQEAIAAACVSYQRLAAQGRLHAARPGTIASFATKHVRSCRHVGGHQDAAKDPMSGVAQARHRFTTRSIDLYDNEAGEWRQIAIADHRNDPIADTAAFRIDYARWLKSLTRRDRRIIAAFTSGETTKAVAGRFGISPGRVSQLRRKYEHLWHIYQGEPTGRAA